MSDILIQLLVFFPLVSNDVGHLIDKKKKETALLGFLVATINDAKRQLNDCLLDCFCCRKSLPAIRLHSASQHCREETSSKNKLLQFNEVRS